MNPPRGSLDEPSLQLHLLSSPTIYQPQSLNITQTFLGSRNYLIKMIFTILKYICRLLCIPKRKPTPTTEGTDLTTETELELRKILKHTEDAMENLRRGDLRRENRTKELASQLEKHIKVESKPKDVADIFRIIKSVLGDPTKGTPHPRAMA